LSTIDWVGAIGGSIGAAGGIGGVLVAVLALKKANAANSIANDSNRISVEANELSQGANDLSKESNVIAVEANYLVRHSWEEERLEREEAKKAKLVFAKDSYGRPAFGFSSQAEGPEIGVRIRNDGKAIARDVHLEVWAFGKRYSPIEPGATIKPEDERRFEFRLPQGIKRPDEAIIFEFQFTYEDDTGPRKWQRCFRFSGSDYPNWIVEDTDCQNTWG
jgi:hypothetical protein